MRTVVFRWAFLVAVSIGGGCDSSPVGPSVDLPLYRLGQRWIYTYDATARDSAGAVVSASHDSLEVRVAAVDDALFGRTGLVRMEARSLLPFVGPGPAPEVESAWYAISTREMVEHAYRNPGAVPVIQTTAAVARSIRFGGFFDPLGPFRAGTASDSIQRREDPRKVLVAPLSKGTTWDSFRLPFYQRREVVGVELLRVLGRDERTARIRTMMPEMSMRLDWEDWISSRGLMRRVIRITSDRYDENFNSLGPIVSTETSSLVAIE